MQSLDHKNLAGFGDLRGRVARYAFTITESLSLTQPLTLISVMMGCMEVCLISIPGKAELYNLHYGNDIAPILRSVCVCVSVRACVQI